MTGVSIFQATPLLQLPPGLSSPGNENLQFLLLPCPPQVRWFISKTTPCHPMLVMIVPVQKSLHIQQLLLSTPGSGRGSEKWNSWLLIIPHLRQNHSC